jgi:hypothetical protein
MAYLGRQPIIGNYQVLDAITASATATYALTKGGVAVFPQTPANCIVSLNGVIQAPFDSYTISGSNIVFASALTGSDSIDFITVLGDVLNVGTVSDGTIGLAKLSATGTKDATTFLRGDNTFAEAGGTQPVFSAYQSSAQTISGSTFTKINFQTEEFDTNSNFDTTLSRFTPTVAGYYYFTANVAIASSATNLLISFYKNGSEFKRTSYIGESAVNALNGSSLISLNGSTDYVEAFVFLANGQNLSASQTSTYFQGFFVTKL